MSTETKEMTREEFLRAEHELQMGITDKLPDGSDLKDVQKNIAKLQKEQEEALRARDDRNRAKPEGETANYLSEKVEVTVAENGVMTASAVVETPVKTDDWTEPENDLPADLPGRLHFLKHEPPITRIEEIAKLDKSGLTAIAGIGGKTADAVLLYDKEPSNEPPADE